MRRIKHLNASQQGLKEEILTFWRGILDKKGLSRSGLEISNQAVFNVEKVLQDYPELDLIQILTAAAERTASAMTSGHHVLNSMPLIGELAQRQRINVSYREGMLEKVDAGLRNEVIIWARAWYRRRNAKGLPVDIDTAFDCAVYEKTGEDLDKTTLRNILQGEIP